MTGKKQNIDRFIATCKTMSSGLPKDVLTEILSVFGKYFELVQGIAFIRNNKYFEQIATYSFVSEEKITFQEGEGITGQAIKDKQVWKLTDVSVKYFMAVSGLGSSQKLQLLIIPLIENNRVEAVLEMAFFKLPDEDFNEKIKTISECYFNKIMKEKNNE